MCGGSIDVYEYSVTLTLMCAIRGHWLQALERLTGKQYCYSGEGVGEGVGEGPASSPYPLQ